MSETKYVCTKCGAKDSDRGVNPPKVLNCHSCHAGSKMELNDMIRLGVGMFPEQDLLIHKAMANAEKN